jgi:hypothetical protein
MDEIDWDTLYRNSIKIGITPISFWEYTLYEKNIMFETYIENKKDEMKFNTISVRNAIHSFMNGVSIDELYSNNNEAENNDNNYIDVLSKQHELDELKSMLLETTCDF